MANTQFSFFFVDPEHQRFKTLFRGRSLSLELHFEMTTVQNSISRWTINLELHFETDHCPELHFETDYCPELHFKADQFKSGIRFRGPNSILRQTNSSSEFRGGPVQKSFIGGLLSKRSGPRYFKGLELKADQRWTPSRGGPDLHLFGSLLEEFEVISFLDVYQTNFEN
ncbi:hypothetical protein RclHR1_09450005 [Rhizophagus clarus]|uniref:Uncharacterized protein n=1 Tax=Rhizophagus clarus TaxID=94130 RepID=A0A2Z6S6M1_9GLOM|nr:hypothetical protein RclHR1_09450005 [Rhizophagus clarus]